MKQIYQPQIFSHFHEVEASVSLDDGKLPPRLVMTKQLHSDMINEVVADGLPVEGDALVTALPGWQVGMRVADCTAVLLYDPKTKAVAAIHSGWRGTKANIITKTVKRLQDTYRTDPNDLWAYMAPAAQICCYKVEAEFAGKFGLRYSRVEDGQHYVDLPKMAFDQLIKAGIPAAHIERDERCTIHDDAQFPSFRRTGETGRMIVTIGRTTS